MGLRSFFIQLIQMRDRLTQTWDRLSQLRDRLIAVFFETIDAEQAKIAKDLTTPPNLLKCRCVKGSRCVECCSNTPPTLHTHSPFKTVLKNCFTGSSTRRDRGCLGGVLVECRWSLKATLHTIETPLQTGVLRNLCGVWCLKQNCANWKYIIFFGALLVLKHVVT
jgi:hypothetical protein